MTNELRKARRRKKLGAALEREGTGFEFVQAIRLLSRLYPDRAAVGGWDDPAREVVRLSVPPSLAFPASEIAELTLPAETTAADGTRGRATEPAKMSVRFMGLTGSQGVLPHVYTSHVAARTRAKDTAFLDFLDLFHHRALSLFYRAWERHRPTVPAERGHEDRLRSHLLDLVGAGTPAVQQRSRVSIDSLAHYTGLLSIRTRPAEALAQLVADYFAVQVRVEQFVGQWQPLRHGGQMCLGADDDDGRLGMAVVGDAVFNALASVRLRIGPLTRAQFDTFLPGGAQHEGLCALARLFADDQVGVEAQLVLSRTEASSASLGASHAPTLGFGTWLGAKPRARDLDDVRLTLC